MKTLFDICIILHGCPPSPDNIIPKEKRWMNWIEKELVNDGYNAIAPDMPTPWDPDYESWKRVIESYDITGDSCLVGHSCGAAFLVRWLLESKKKVKKLILVAPAKVQETEDDSRGKLYDFELPAGDQEIADEITIFTSNDFPHHLKSLKLYEESLKPKVIRLENKGHFLIYTMGTNEFPELLEEILH